MYYERGGGFWVSDSEVYVNGSGKSNQRIYINSCDSDDDDRYLNSISHLISVSLIPFLKKHIV